MKTQWNSCTCTVGAELSRAEKWRAERDRQQRINDWMVGTLLTADIIDGAIGTVALFSGYIGAWIASIITIAFVSFAIWVVKAEY